MKYYSEFLQNAQKQTGLKAKMKNRLFAGLMSGLEAVNKDMEELSLRDNALEEQIADANVRIDEARDYMKMLEERILRLEKHIRILDADQKQLKTDHDGASLNLQNNNAAIDSLHSDMDFIKLKLSSVEKKLRSAPAASAAPAASVQESAAAPPADNGSDSEYESIDYFDFENHFRGSIENIKKAQEYYLRYFSGKSRVIDIGCGRGEFLSLMKDNDIPAQGVDIYEPYVEYCNMKGLTAHCGDGTAFLAKQESTDGIFVGQVVEHLQTHEIIRLCNTAYEKLIEGGCIIIETPNPTSLSIYTNAFYIDPSHIKPVHPLTMKYYLEKAGFRNIEIIYTEGSRPPYSIPPLRCADAENADEFNEAMKRVSDMIFGSQDYAIVAVK